MKNLSAAFRRKLYANEKDYIAYADITLEDETVLNLSNSEIWTGGFSYEEVVGEDDNFSAIGSAVIGSASLTINNIYETYSEYDFTNAQVVLYLGMYVDSSLGTVLEKFKIGTYVVDDTRYNGATITLSLLDHMEYFNEPYDKSTLTYPATLSAVVREACTKCGATLNTPNFPHNDFTVNKPTDATKGSMTFRDVISQCAAIAGCFAKINPDGQLELKWFNTSELDSAMADLDGGSFNPWSTGTEYNGGTFNPWSVGDETDGGSFQDTRPVHYISSLYSQTIAVDDVIITGVRAVVENEASSETDERETIYTTGTDGYVISIEGNNFITNENAQTIVDWLGVQLIGLRFRKLNITCGSNPDIDAGDTGIVIDRKQNVYRILITRMSFSIGSPQTIVCGASTPTRNSSSSYSSLIKSYAKIREQIRYERTARELAEAQLAEDIENASGLYETEVTDPQTQEVITYLHDKPNLNESLVQIMISSIGVTVTADGGEHWYGLRVNGDLIARILTATGVNADWINTGTISSEDGSVSIDLDNNTVNIKGITNFSGFITDTDLSTAGQTTINGANITTGIIQDAHQNVIINLTTGSITINSGSINLGNGNFVVTSNGILTAKGASLEGLFTSTRDNTTKIVIDSARLDGYVGQEIVGALDLVALFQNNQRHVTLTAKNDIRLYSGASGKVSIFNGTAGSANVCAEFSASGIALNETITTDVTIGTTSVNHNLRVNGNISAEGGSLTGIISNGLTSGHVAVCGFGTKLCFWLDNNNILYVTKDNGSNWAQIN